MDTKILEQIEELFSEEFALVQHDLAALETAVQEKMQLLGQGLMQRLVNRSLNGYQGPAIPCECGSSMKFMQHRPKYVHTLFGWIQIRRAYYRCQDCGRTAFPYDIVSGLGSDQISPALAKACCMLAVDDSFEQTSRKIEVLFGQKVSDNTIERVVHRVGSVAAEQADQQLQWFFKHRHIPEPQANPERLYVAVDSTTAHEIDGWHEAKVASIYWENQHCKDLSRFVARFDNSENSPIFTRPRLQLIYNYTTPYLPISQK